MLDNFRFFGSSTNVSRCCAGRRNIVATRFKAGRLLNVLQQRNYIKGGRRDRSILDSDINRDANNLGTKLGTRSAILSIFEQL